MYNGHTFSKRLPEAQLAMTVPPPPSYHQISKALKKPSHLQPQVISTTPKRIPGANLPLVGRVDLLRPKLRHTCEYPTLEKQATCMI